MARPRKFVADAALEAAMQSFWRHGYQSTSFDLLVSMTGASRHSLYLAFGDKDRLLMASVQHYEKTVLGTLLDSLGQPDAGIAALKHFFQSIANLARDESGRAGCLICNCRAELPENSAVLEHINQFFERVRQLFLKCLKSARKRGNLARTRDLNALSHYLLALIPAISVNARSNPSKEGYDSYVEVALSVLG